MHTFLVLDLGLDVVDGVAALDLDRRPGTARSKKWKKRKRGDAPAPPLLVAEEGIAPPPSERERESERAREFVSDVSTRGALTRGNVAEGPNLPALAECQMGP